MEAFDQRKSSRTNNIERSGNPEFESRLTLNSREVSGKSEEGALEEEENQIPQSMEESCGGASKFPRGAMGAAAAVRCRNERG
jgi:hypothetical protein